MILKFKNKYQMAIDGMIADATQAGGIPDFILLEAQEAFNLLLEASKLKTRYSAVLAIKHGDINTTMKIWNQGITNAKIKEITEEWYTRKCTVFYNNIELRIIKQKKKQDLDPYTKAGLKTAPLRYNLEGKICNSCRSSIRRKWWFGYDKGCINPACENYYKDK